MYNSLTKWIKNDLVHHNKPTMLSDLRKLIQAIDSRYWERKVEISHKNASGTSRNTSENKSDNSKTKKGKGSSKSKQKDSNSSSGSTSSKGSSLESKKSNPDLLSKLRKDSSLPLRKDNTVSTKTFVSSVVCQDIWLKIVQKALLLLRKLAQPQLLPHLSLPRLRNLWN